MAKQDIPVRSVQPPSSLKLTQHLSYRRLVMPVSSKISSRFCRTRIPGAGLHCDFFHGALHRTQSSNGSTPARGRHRSSLHFIDAEGEHLSDPFCLWPKARA